MSFDAEKQIIIASYNSCVLATSIYGWAIWWKSRDENRLQIAHWLTIDLIETFGDDECRSGIQ